MTLNFALLGAGRIGRLRKVTCATGPNPRGGPFPERPVPGHLNWDLWLGPAPKTPYVEERCHYTFRWWYEYAGGKVTECTRNAEARKATALTVNSAS